VLASRSARLAATDGAGGMQENNGRCAAIDWIWCAAAAHRI